MQQWFLQLSRRDQVMVALLAGFLLLYILYIFAWKPIADVRESLRLQNVAAEQDLQEVIQLVAEYQILSTSSTSKKNDGRSLPTIIDETVSANKLTMGRFQPNASGDVQVRFDNANFDYLITWLYQLDNEYSIALKEMSISPGNNKGLVNASVRLYRD